MPTFEVLLRQRRVVVAAGLLLTVAALPGVLRLESDNPPGDFFTGDVVARNRYHRFQELFSHDRVVRISISGPGLWTEPGLYWLGDLEPAVARLRGVEGVGGLYHHQRWLLPEWPPDSPEDLRRAALDDPLDRGAGWIAPEGDMVTVSVLLEDLPKAAERRLLEELEELLAQAPPGLATGLSGLALFHRALDRALDRIATRVIPLLGVLAAGLLLIVFVRIGEVVRPLIYVGCCLTLLFGALGYLGAHVNIVSSVVVPLLFVITLATALHLLVHLRGEERRAGGPAVALASTFEAKRWPVVWAGITTAVAFGSLITGAVPPVRTLGAWAGAGIVLLTGMALTFYPALLAGRRNAGEPHRPGWLERGGARLGRTLAAWAVAHRRALLAVVGGLATVAVAGLARLDLRDDLARYFVSGHPVRAELERLDRHGLGVFAAELMIETPPLDRNDGTGFRDPVALDRLAELTRRLREQPGVRGAFGVGDAVASLVHSMVVEGDPRARGRWLALGLLQTAPEGRSLLERSLSADGQTARITLSLPAGSYQEIDPILDRARSLAGAAFPRHRVWVTGRYPLLLVGQESLLRSMLLSFGLTVFCVAVAFAFVLPDLRLATWLLVPNLWPVLLVLGTMGWAGLPLDSAAMMTASVALGLAVDDTFHSLGRFRRLIPALPPTAAAVATLEGTAPAHLLTSSVLVAGFAACSANVVVPVARMGALVATAVILALAADLLVVPALLAATPREVADRWGRGTPPGSGIRSVTGRRESR